MDLVNIISENKHEVDQKKITKLFFIALRFKLLFSFIYLVPYFVFLGLNLYFIRRLKTFIKKKRNIIILVLQKKTSGEINRQKSHAGPSRWIILTCLRAKLSEFQKRIISNNNSNRAPRILISPAAKLINIINLKKHKNSDYTTKTNIRNENPNHRYASAYENQDFQDLEL